jgi:hypothetical protein
MLCGKFAHTMCSAHPVLVAPPFSTGLKGSYVAKKTKNRKKQKFAKQ